MNTFFKGYPRADGRVGIRNHVLILPTSICASDLCSQVARSCQGCVTFHNQNGCSQVDIDQKVTIDTLVGFACNPNIYGIVCVSLGCEGCQNDCVIEAIKSRCNKPIRSVIIQNAGGSMAAYAQALRYAKELSIQASLMQREKTPISELILGTECGGSDPSSGLGSNPLIGMVSDWLVDQGGTSVLSETPELFGAEQILSKRAKTKEIADKLLKIVYDYEKYVQMFGAQMREGNPSPGNMAGGLTTLEEKSLGCIHKGGHSPLNAVYEYAQPLKAHEGLVVMDTPGNDPSSVAGMIAGGCQLVVFSTGLGTPTGNALAPVYRLTANPETYKAMKDNTDLDASPTIYGPETMTQMRDKMIEDIIQVCNGRLVCAEALGYTETALPHICNYM